MFYKNLRVTSQAPTEFLISHVHTKQWKTSFSLCGIGTWLTRMHVQRYFILLEIHFAPIWPIIYDGSWNIGTWVWLSIIFSYTQRFYLIFYIRNHAHLRFAFFVSHMVDPTKTQSLLLLIVLSAVHCTYDNRFEQ